ncbi:nuclear transport factor 2 family protein [Spirosoma arcticum]
MYQLLALILSLGSALAQAQDFRAVPPAEQPNAAELAYFGGKHPNLPVDKADDAANAQLVSGFLTDLTTGQFEAARNRLAGDFVAYGPGYDDKLGTDDLLNQWDRNGRLFPSQHLTFETITPVNVLDGNNRGQWVYVKGTWSAPDGRERGGPIRLSFHHMARVSNNKIQRTYTSYGNDQLFYDRFGGPARFPLYNRPVVSQNR